MMLSNIIHSIKKYTYGRKLNMNYYKPKFLNMLYQNDISWRRITYSYNQYILLEVILNDITLNPIIDAKLISKILNKKHYFSKET